MPQLTEYFEALDRLKNGRPQIVAKGTKITNDAVSTEAGRGKGSIKKSRPVYSKLIESIDAAAKEQTSPLDAQKQRLDSAMESSKKFRQLWEHALAREVSLVAELYEARKLIAKLTGEKVLPLRKKTVKDTN